MSIAAKVTEAVRAVCPIHGVSIGRRTEKKTWRIDFKDEASAKQRTAAQIVVDTFDVAAALRPEAVTAPAVLKRQREEALTRLGAVIESMPAAQREPFLLMLQLLRD